MFGQQRPVGYCVYPDSDKIADLDAERSDERVRPLGDRALDYYDGS